MEWPKLCIKIYMSITLLKLVWKLSNINSVSRKFTILWVIAANIDLVVQSSRNKLLLFMLMYEGLLLLDHCYGVDILVSLSSLVSPRSHKQFCKCRLAWHVVERVPSIQTAAWGWVLRRAHRLPPRPDGAWPLWATEVNLCTRMTLKNPVR